MLGIENLLMAGGGFLLGATTIGLVLALRSQQRNRIAQAKIDRFKTEINGKTQRLEVIGKKVRVKEEALEQLNQTINKHQSTIERLQQELEEAHQISEQQQQENIMLQKQRQVSEVKLLKEVAASNKKLEELSEILTEQEDNFYQRQNEQKEQFKEQLEQKYQALEQKKDELQNQQQTISKLEKQNVKLEATVQEQQQFIEKLEEEHQQRKKEMQALQEQFNEEEYKLLELQYSHQKNLELRAQSINKLRDILQELKSIPLPEDLLLDEDHEQNDLALQVDLYKKELDNAQQKLYTYEMRIQEVANIKDQLSQRDANIEKYIEIIQQLENKIRSMIA